MSYRITHRIGNELNSLEIEMANNRFAALAGAERGAKIVKIGVATMISMVTRKLDTRLTNGTGRTAVRAGKSGQN